MSEYVRCIDCEKRKKCKKVRVNKYAKKPCADYETDLEKEARANEHEARLKLGV